MKRFILFLAVLALVIVPAVASAGKWVTKEVQWQVSSVGSPRSATEIYVRDTLRTSIGPVDTTSSFSLDNASVPRGIGLPGGLTSVGPASDTSTVAFLVVQGDTAANLTPALTSITCLIDGRLGGYGAVTDLASGWVKADSALANGAAGGGMILADDTVAFPIRSISPYGSIWRFGQLRARITGVGGATGIPAARVFLRYWQE